MKQIIALLVFLMILAGACKKSTGRSASSALPADSNTAMVADTIIYQVVINNPNDDPWVEKCLKGLHKKALIDSVFNMVYAGKIFAFNHETNEKLTIRQVRDLETKNGYSRDQIGMIQFTEAWYLNTRTRSMNKKVLTMVLGYNIYTPEGELIGPKPLFRIEMD